MSLLRSLFQGCGPLPWVCRCLPLGTRLTGLHRGQIFPVPVLQGGSVELRSRPCFHWLSFCFVSAVSAL